MTKRVKALLDSFDHLNEREQQELVATLLRRRAPSDYPRLSDEELIRIAEERFLELDYSERESV